MVSESKNSLVRQKRKGQEERKTKKKRGGRRGGRNCNEQKSLRFRSTTFSLAGTLQFSSANSNDYWISFVTRKDASKIPRGSRVRAERFLKFQRLEKKKWPKWPFRVNHDAKVVAKQSSTRGN